MSRENDWAGLNIVLAGRPLVLRYSVNSLCDIEDLTGMPIDRLLDRQYSAIRLLLWAGLHACQPELTVRDVGELLTDCLSAGGSLEAVVDLCAQALRAAGLVGG